MKKDWLDKKLKQKLTGFEMPVDLDAAWDSLEHQRKKDKKKNIFLPFIGVAIVIVSLGIFFNQQQKQGEITFNTIVSDLNSTTEKNQRLVERNPNEIATKGALDTSLKVDRSHYFDETAPTKISKAFFADKDLKTNIFNGNTPEISSLNLPVKDQQSNSKTAFVKANLQTESTSSISESESDPKLQDHQFVSLNPLRSIPLQAFELEEMNKDLPGSVLNFKKKNSNKKKNAVKISSVYGLTKMTKKNQNLDEDVFSFIDESEKSVDLSGARFEYNYYLSDQLYLRTGLSYQLWSDRIKIQNTKPIDELKENYPVEIRQYNNGELDTLFEDILVENIEIATFDIWNKSHYLGVPISIGYEWTNKSLFGLDINAGIIANYLINSDIHYLSRDNRLESISQDDFKSFIFQFEAGVTLFYKLNNNTRLNLGLQTIADLTDRKTLEASFNSRYNSYNVNLGLTKQF